MAINVICPGCMTRFQVGDQFAGRKGNCPKCGHLIEIPKEKLVIHAPDSITADGKTYHGGDSTRPIAEVRYKFSRKAVLLSITGVIVVTLAAWLIGLLGVTVLSRILGIVGVFLVGFPLVEFGFMMVRDNNDLEILLGNERHKRSLYVTLGFAVIWFVFEGLMLYMGQSMFMLIYLVPVLLLGAAVAVVIFDIDYGKGTLVFLVFLFSMIFLRGLVFAQPYGWIWIPDKVQGVAVERKAVSPTADSLKTESGSPEAVDPTSEAADGDLESLPSKAKPAKKTPPRAAPDPKKSLKR